MPYKCQVFCAFANTKSFNAAPFFGKMHKKPNRDKAKRPAQAERFLCDS